MSALFRSAVVVRKVLPLSPSAVFNQSPASWRSGLLLARAASGRSILTEIERKNKEAELGGGQKRIDTQHKKVSLFLQIFVTINLINLYYITSITSNIK